MIENLFYGGTQKEFGHLTESSVIYLFFVAFISCTSYTLDMFTIIQRKGYDYVQLHTN
uniref:Uncharacterized protein n=1 Tax=Siphoviridae sp. ctkKt3 TaxID=2825642 RepID=A0A8S5UYQ7_9CAUD|nr:MAG TPA: hypothetical protein [Siphoviridae sp. ctkKt3]